MKSARNQMLIGVVALAIAQMIWGIGTPLFKLALVEIPIFTLAFLRFFVAGIILLVFTRSKWQKTTKCDFLRIVLASFFGIFILITLFFWGLTIGESISASLIAAGIPILTYILAVLGLHEKPNGRIFKGILIGFFGILIIILSPLLAQNNINWGQLQANILFTIAMSCMAIETVIIKPVVNKINPLQVTTIAFLFSGILFFIMAVLSGQLSILMVNKIEFWGKFGIFWGIFFSSIIAYSLYYFGISKLKAQETGLFNYFNPLASSIVAYFLLGERLNPSYLIGACFVIFGIMYAEKLRVVK